MRERQQQHHETYRDYVRLLQGLPRGDEGGTFAGDHSPLGLMRQMNLVAKAFLPQDSLPGPLIPRLPCSLVLCEDLDLLDYPGEEHLRVVLIDQSTFL